MEFPTLLYKSPGPHQHQGMSYKYVGCRDEEHLAELTEQGWHASIEEAAGGLVQAEPRKRGRTAKGES